MCYGGLRDFTPGRLAVARRRKPCFLTNGSADRLWQVRIATEIDWPPKAQPVFNNPFHRVAAEAKDEREQLDRLLRISAPHERIVLAAAALVVLAFAVWLLFGTVVRSVTVEGVLIEPGKRHMAFSAEPGQLLDYLVAPGDRVEAGQPVARQSVPDMDREINALRDRVAVLRAAFERTGGGSEAIGPLLASTRTALLQMEARRSARQEVVAPSAGAVSALLSAPGEYVSAGAAIAEVREAGAGAFEAVLHADPELAGRLRPGMAASVEVPMPGGGTRRLQGTVARTAAGPLPGWLARLTPAFPPSSHRVDIVLDEVPSFAVADGTPCRIRLELGRHAPAALFASGRS